MEHKLITGGEQYLPFARSRIKAMRATGLAYASQQFEIDGCSVKVRIEPGQDYIRLEGGGSFVSVYPGVQPPEIDIVVGVPAIGLQGVKMLTGYFPETFIDPALVGAVADPKSGFGTSPFSRTHIRRTRVVTSLPLAVIPGDPVSRTGVVVGGSKTYKIFVGGALTATESLPSPYYGFSGYSSPPLEVGGVSFGGWSKYSWLAQSSELVHCVNSGGYPLLTTLEVRSEESIFTVLSDLGPDLSGDTRLFGTEAGTETTAGTSFVLIHIVKKVTAEDGTKTDAYSRIEAGRLDYYWGDGRKGNTANDGFEHVDLWQKITNDVECTLQHRRWHAIDRVCAAPNGSIFVLRETSSFEMHDTFSHWGITTVPGGNTVNISRGYTLSFVSDKGVVKDHIISRPLGTYGYIEGVIPSADGTKVYVYYGKYRSGEPEPVISKPTLNAVFPVLFDEFLDEIEISKQDGEYSFSLAKTISLGPVTLRLTEYYEAPDQTDHFESKLHGASLCVNGFIWSNRYCYDVTKNVFIDIPDYEEMIPVSQLAAKDRSRDQITGSIDDVVSYLQVADSGKSATYILAKFGTVRGYKLVAGAEGQPDSIMAANVSWIPGGFSYGEYTSAESFVFSGYKKQ